MGAHCAKTSSRKTGPETVEQNAQKTCPEKYQLAKIKTGRIAAIVDFNMRNIWKTVLDNYIINIKQNVRLHGRVHPEKFNLSNKIAGLRPLLT